MLTDGPATGDGPQPPIGASNPPNSMPPAAPAKAAPSFDVLISPAGEAPPIDGSPIAASALSELLAGPPPIPE